LWDRTNQYEDDFKNELKAREKLVEGGIVWGDDFPKEDRDIFVSSVTETLENVGGGSGRERTRIPSTGSKALGR
jgi:hypothetical protein